MKLELKPYTVVLLRPKDPEDYQFLVLFGGTHEPKFFGFQF